MGKSEIPEEVPSAQPSVESDGRVRLPAMTLPFSTFASRAAREAFVESQRTYPKVRMKMRSVSISEQRKIYDEYLRPALARTNELYPTDTAVEIIAGVCTDVISPKEGIPERNRDRVLINLHGGGFVLGSRIMGALESAPVATLANIKVVSVDYRQGPEHTYPAASEDVVAVYQELLKSYGPDNIGIYGCSAGGFLTAEVIACLANRRVPRPGAIGILAASAAGWTGGDSGGLAPALNGVATRPDAVDQRHPHVANASYFSHADFNDPLVAPISSAAVLTDFPPTLLMTSTRDMALSPAVHTHTQLIRLGVDSELHVWEGLGHAFFATDPDLPESTEVWNVVKKFFDKHLWRGASR